MAGGRPMEMFRSKGEYVYPNMRISSYTNEHTFIEEKNSDGGGYQNPNSLGLAVEKQLLLHSQLLKHNL